MGDLVGGVTEPGGEQRRRRVLVVDDDPPILLLVQRMLMRDYDVTTVGFARDALDLIDAGERFDMILCDLMMPEMSGMELRESLSRTHPPMVERVVFFTAGAGAPHIKEFLAQVSNRYLEKPFLSRQLKEIIEIITR